MAPEDMVKTSFITEWGTYCYRVMPFGLKNAGATYQRAATTLFHDMMHRDVEVYVDDMIVKSRDRADHLAALQRFFERIRQFRLRLNPKKCTFGVTSGKLLGHIVSERGIEVDPEKIRAILDMPTPRTEKEIRGFLGRLQYISRFIARLTDICEPIFRLLRKNQPTVWNDDCQCAFERIKECLLSPPVLVPPTPGRPLLLYLSVSDMALGCMLAQLDDLGKERAIYYLSKRMLEYECKYIMIERLCLAVVWASRRLRHYMIEHSVLLVSRLDPLRYLFDKPVLTGRLMRWLVLLTEFDIHYVTQKSVKGSIVADHLASLPISDDRSIDDDFPDEQIVSMTSITGWRLYFDGAANQSGFGIGILLMSPQGDHIPRSVRLAFSDHHRLTNNIVEYKACITGLETALDLGIRQLEIHGDSNLVIKQTQGIWRTRDEKLKPYHAYLDLLIDRFDVLRYIHLPRVENQFADALATLASLIVIPAGVNVRPLLIETRSAPAYCCLIGEIEDQIELPWYHDIYQFLSCGTYPESASAKDRRALRQLATRFVVCGDALYRRSPDGLLLLCLDRASADRVMREVHAGIVASLYRDVRSGIDIIGKISPKSSSGHEYILVAIDYFTKWVEAASYARLTAARVAKFIRSHIICRYGVPHELISDKGVHFKGEVDTLIQEYGIQHHRSSAYRPQTNGAVEASSFYHLYSLRFCFPFCDDDALSSQSYQSGLSHLAHMVLRYLTLRTQGFSIIYWEIWAFVPHRFIYLLPLAYITVSITSGDIEGHILSFHLVYLPQYSDEMLMVDMSQITDDVKPETVSPLDLFKVLAIEMVEDVQFVPTPGLFTIIAHDDDVFEGVTSPVMVESKVMSFGLKNARVTYQRAATTIFHNMMHRDVEVYVDDMIVKS
ncbi:uncharacterized protein LOC132252789 [Vitis vinifera]|uniref:uncharacterized protein LOC132252789 n=1 Tax=Vitis vinifera TaxID=29760 RepID=UPI002883294E|nr:uncharacterized protein LOC132252789 [Vitis vinifera]